MTARPWVLHPFLLAPMPALVLYARNLNALPFSDALMPAALALALAVAAFGGLRLARLDGPGAGMVASSAVLLFFGFGQGVRAMGRLGIDDRRLAEPATLAIEAAAVAAVAVATRARPGAARRLNRPANAASAALAGLWLAGVASQIGAGPASRPPPVARGAVPRLDPRPARRPDVYFLVLDAYGRSDVLREFQGFDNRAFVDRLERKGFFVARRATANYCQTALSLAATLNLRYLDELAGSRSPSRLPLRALIADALAFRAFRAMGYRVVAFATGYGPTELPGADRYVQPPGNLGAFPGLVAEMTPLWLLAGSREAHDPHRMHRERVLGTLDGWPEAARGADRPTFCFAHVLAPHPPFDFGADGRDTSSAEGPFSLNDSEGWCRAEGHGGPEEYSARYREQAAYVTGRVEQAVDRILAAYEPGNRPVIVIQGDHGPGSRFDSGADRPNDLRERMGILNALYLPDAGRGGLPDSITPVNTFRVVLDRYFGAGLGLLGDRNYHSSYEFPYLLNDVTDDLACHGEE